MLEQQRDYVLHTVEERGVRLIRLWFTDVLGSLKSFAISPAELENAFDEGSCLVARFANRQLQRPIEDQSERAVLVVLHHQDDGVHEVGLHQP